MFKSAANTACLALFHAGFFGKQAMIIIFLPNTGGERKLQGSWELRVSSSKTFPPNFQAERFLKSFKHVFAKTLKKKKG